MSKVPDVTLKLDASVSVDSDGDVVKTFKFSILCSAAESLNAVQPISQPFLNGFS